MSDENQDEYYDGGEPDYDYDEMNKQMILGLNNNMENTNNNIKNDEISTLKSNLSTKIDEEDSKQLNPIKEFFRIKNEIDSIEKDINFYNEHKELFKDSLSYKNSLEELKKIKDAANFVFNDEKFQKIHKDYKNSQILNMKMTDKLNEHLLKRIEIINKLKSDNPEYYYNIDYKLILTSDNMKNKRKNQLEKIKNKIKEIEFKIGKINNEKKEETLLNIILELKKNIQLYDKKFLKELETVSNTLKQKIEESSPSTLNSKRMHNTIELMNNAFHEKFSSIQDLEKTIINIITIMESKKNIHEENAFIKLKIKDLINQQEKISANIDENIELLDQLKENIKNNNELMKKNINILKNKIIK